MVGVIHRVRLHSLHGKWKITFMIFYIDLDYACTRIYTFPHNSPFFPEWMVYCILYCSLGLYSPLTLNYMILHIICRNLFQSRTLVCLIVTRTASFIIRNMQSYEAFQFPIPESQLVSCNSKFQILNFYVTRSRI